jgi:general secretion pathway protein D
MLPVLRLKDGETLVQSGLISGEDRGMANKMHGVGELPMLNRLFGSQKDNAMRSIRCPDPMTTEFNSGDGSPAAGDKSGKGGQ